MRMWKGRRYKTGIKVGYLTPYTVDPFKGEDFDTYKVKDQGGILILLYLRYLFAIMSCTSEALQPPSTQKQSPTADYVVRMMYPS